MVLKDVERRPAVDVVRDDFAICERPTSPKHTRATGIADDARVKALKVSHRLETG
jgi:hypothetical protein